MDNISRTTSFILDKMKDNPEYARVRYRVRYASYMVAFNVGVVVTISKWNTDTQRCRRNSLHGSKMVQAVAINVKLDNMEKVVDEAFDTFDSVPTPDELRDLVNDMLGKNKKDNGSSTQENTLAHICNKYLVYGERERGWVTSSVQNNNVTLKWLCENYPDMKIEDIDNEWYKDVIQRLLSSGFKNSSVNTKNTLIRAFVQWAIKNKYIADKDCLDSQPVIKRLPKTVIFLTKEELSRFREYDFGNRVKNYYRDAYCFSAYTSLRFSDITKILIGQVYDNMIHHALIKTSKPIEIELNKYSKEIFERVSDGRPSSDRLFKRLSCVVTLENTLKSMFKEIGIDTPISVSYYKGNKRVDEMLPKYELLTFHTARKTFVCTALSMGIPPQVVMKWTGHSDYKAMKPYIDIATDTKKQAMSLFDII